MATRTRWTALAAGALAVAGMARADESQVRLKEAPGAILVRSACSGCHSLDYVQMNAGFLKRENWEAEVKKMIKVMGAPVPAEDVPAIVDYLVRNYGAP